MNEPKKEPKDKNESRFITEAGDLERVDSPKSGEKEKSVLDLLIEQGLDVDALTKPE